MSFPNIAISLKSSRIKATSLAKGISCGNRRFLSSNCGATYYGPFRASRRANRDSASSHPALRNPLNYHLESRVVRDLWNRTIVSHIEKRRTNWVQLRRIRRMIPQEYLRSRTVDPRTSWC